LHDARIFSYDARVFAMHENHKEKHDVEDDDVYYGSFVALGLLP
jgi:hypothetical protein